MKKLLIAILTIFLMSGIWSCSPEKRLARLIHKFPHLVKSDTVYVNDTVTIEGIKHDTAFYFNQKDTVIVEKGGLVMKYFYHNDTVFLAGEVKEKTIIKKIPVQVNTVKAIVKRGKWWVYPLVGLFGFLIAFFFMWLIAKGIIRLS